MTGKFSDKMEQTLIEQIRNEYFSAYLYLSMSACCQYMDLPGIAHWLRVQAEEEIKHGDKIFIYMVERGAKVKLLQIDQPGNEWISTLAMFKNGLDHEHYITERINNLMTIAIEDKDYATQSFLKWFIDEQVEEESSFEAVVAKFEMIGASKGSLIYIDKEMAKRKAD